MRGASTVLGGVCADLPQKCGKAALSYSTPSVTRTLIQATGSNIFIVTGVYPDARKELLTMATNKLDRIERDIEKTKTKIAELQKQLRELEAAKTEQENLQIVQLVRGLNMTPQEFAAFVRGGALQAPPAPQPEFEQEDNADEE